MGTAISATTVATVWVARNGFLGSEAPSNSPAINTAAVSCTAAVFCWSGLGQSLRNEAVGGSPFDQNTQPSIRHAEKRCRVKILSRTRSSVFESHGRSLRVHCGRCRPPHSSPGRDKPTPLDLNALPFSHWKTGRSSRLSFFAARVRNRADPIDRTRRARRPWLPVDRIAEALRADEWSLRRARAQFPQTSPVVATESGLHALAVVDYGTLGRHQQRRNGLRLLK